MQVIVMRMIVVVMSMVVLVLDVVMVKKRGRPGGGVHVAGDADASDSDGYGNAIGEC